MGTVTSRRSRGWCGGCQSSALLGRTAPRRQPRRQPAELGAVPCGVRARSNAALLVPPPCLSPLSPPPARLCVCLSVHMSVCPSVSLSRLSPPPPPPPLGDVPFPSSNAWDQLISCSVCGGPFPAVDLRPNSMLLLNKLLFGSWLFGLVFPPLFLFFF